jgi:hypothetical protein
MEHMISAGRQVDILAIPGRAFFKHFDQEKVNRLMEISCDGAIVLQQNFHCFDGFGKVLVKHLSPVGQVPTQEYIFELMEGFDICHVYLFRSSDEITDRFIDREFNAEIA